jgi:hypothetical protein
MLDRRTGETVISPCPGYAPTPPATARASKSDRQNTEPFGPEALSPIEALAPRGAALGGTSGRGSHP